MESKFKHIPQNQRKKILLICDDIRVHSGVATVAREIVQKTSHHFNWVNIGGAIKHPDLGKVLDLSDNINKKYIIWICIMKLFFGFMNSLLDVIKREKPDYHGITDPRYFFTNLI